MVSLHFLSQYYAERYKDKLKKALINAGFWLYLLRESPCSRGEKADDGQKHSFIKSSKPAPFIC